MQYSRRTALFTFVTRLTMKSFGETYEIQGTGSVQSGYCPSTVRPSATGSLPFCDLQMVLSAFLIASLNDQNHGQQI